MFGGLLRHTNQVESGEVKSKKEKGICHENSSKVFDFSFFSSGRFGRYAGPGGPTAGATVEVSAVTDGWCYD